MITSGVDLAARPERTALASIEWTASHAIIRDVIYPAGDDVILEAIQQACKTGIDCPFGWPGAFVGFVTAHQIGHVGIPQDSGGAGAGNSSCAARTPSFKTSCAWCR